MSTRITKQLKSIIQESSTFRKWCKVLMWLFIFDLAALCGGAFIVYIYHPMMSWLAGQPYQWHNWSHIIVKFGPSYLITILMSGFLVWYFHRLLKDP